MAAALTAFLDRQAAEERVSIESFLRNYPDLADELRPELRALTEIDCATAPEEADDALPARLSGLDVAEEIGSGGMGRVLIAEDERLGRKVAIKTLHPRYASNPELRQRFMNEARAMARISHPNIVRIYSLGPANEPPHFVMEYLDGAPLNVAARALPFREKARLMHKVLLALAFLHEQRVIHRDLKPANILVGRDLEPKLLDFGLALDAGTDALRLTHAGQFLGTPDYASPEHAHTASAIDARSDIFSIGIIFYELLTGELPFRAQTLTAQVRARCEEEAVPPRRLNPDVPAELQNVCLKALEKDPASRYASAAEMALDLERYLAGEPVLALPVSVARAMSGRIEQHLRELDGWRSDKLLTEFEYENLQKAYGRLSEREDAWIMETRRLSIQQVSLYFGGWLLVMGAALIVLFRYRALHGIASVLLAIAAAGPTAWLGLKLWRGGRQRIAIAFLLAFCLLLPVTILVAMGEYGIFAGPSRGREDLELFSKLPSFRRTSNAQLWWAIILSLPAYYWLRRFTRSSVFSLVLSTFAALLAVVTLLRLGLIDWLDTDPGRPYFYLIPWAVIFLAAGLALERRRLTGDSRYFYPFFVVFTYVSLTGLAAFHQPYANWLQAAAPWTRSQVEYLFLINAGVYLLLQWACEIPSSPQMRSVARAFRFVIPGHVLISLLLLGIAAPEHGFESRVFEVLLPVAAAGFVFGSIPKQMKNFFASGLLFLAVGLVRLQQDLFKDQVLWPAFLLCLGIVVMLTAARLRRT